MAGSTSNTRVLAGTAGETGGAPTAASNSAQTQGAVLGWGLWNARLTEWFNPGTRKPFYPTREAAERMAPVARRQYSMGNWELREYRLEDAESDDSGELTEAS